MSLSIKATKKNEQNIGDGQYSNTMLDFVDDIQLETDNKVTRC